MNKLLGWMMTGGLLLGYASTSKAQITIQPGRNGSPSVTFGQPSYGPQYAPPYAQPNYVQPGFGQTYRPGYGQPYYPQGTYSSGYSRYTYPGAANTQPYNYPNSGYPGLYRPQPGPYNNGYYPNTQPYRPQGTGVIINGRSFTLPQ